MEQKEICLSHKDEERFLPSTRRKDAGFPEQEGITVQKQRAILFRELQKVAEQIEVSEKQHQALAKQRKALEQQLAALDEQSTALEKQYTAWEKQRVMLNEHYVWLEHRYCQSMQR